MKFENEKIKPESFSFQNQSFLKLMIGCNEIKLKDLNIHRSEKILDFHNSITLNFSEMDSEMFQEHIFILLVGRVYRFSVLCTCFQCKVR